MYDGFFWSVGILVLWTLFGFGVLNIEGLIMRSVLSKAYNVKRTTDDVLEVMNQWAIDHNLLTYGDTDTKASWADVLIDSFTWPSTIYRTYGITKRILKDTPKN